MDIEQEIIGVLRQVLSIDERGHPLDAMSPLLGHVAELDSMAVVSILTTLEDRLGIVIDDDEVDGRTFASVGSLVRFVRDKLES